ncbi:MAG: oxygen-dependent coproporphyrinogen oxidase [Deltaproteobacteria bacterium]|nr:oxygen-dependent coproporphyrinogen oxidase [Deltaproteobacteria bacterium]
MERIARRTQDAICAALGALDGAPFEETAWEREGGGGGRSRVLQDGNVFEKAGCGVSVVHGELSSAAAASMRPGKPVPADLRFYACGVSMVVHPRNPLAPTFHANFRMMEVGGDAWFGGGADLTPSYLFEEDARHFHGTLKAACDRHDPAHWPRFKRWCDEYFLIVHRGERRGVGGFFFDDLPDALPFVDDCAASLVEAYLPIVERRKDLPFTDAHRRWQQLRRGRYVEFNLVYDRGTTFGLKTNARVDAVLMSLPLTARWEVGHEPEPGSEEARLLEVLRVPRDWV